MFMALVLKAWISDGEQTDIWNSRRLGEGIGEDATSVTAGSLGLKRSWKEAEAWHHGGRVRVLEEMIEKDILLS